MSVFSRKQPKTIIHSFSFSVFARLRGLPSMVLVFRYPSVCQGFARSVHLGSRSCDGGTLDEATARVARRNLASLQERHRNVQGRHLLSEVALARRWELGGWGPSQSFLFAGHREIARRELRWRRHPKP